MTDHAREVRYGLTDVTRLCTALGLLDGAQRQASGLLVPCPAHADRTPSCSVTTGPDGTIRAKCFACDWSADALGLIGMVRGRSTRDDFREILAEGASIAGLLSLEAEILDGEPRPERPVVQAPARKPPAGYPAMSEVLEVWGRATRADEDREACRYLVGRLIDPVLVADRSLARVIVPPLPGWARTRAGTWHESGHRLVVRAFDALGRPYGLRAIQIQTNDPPKRIPPTGKRCSELVLANVATWKMLTGRDNPSRVIVVEGEPDFLSWGTITEEPIIGLVSGSWSEAFAASIPRGCRVVIRTHEDDAGERYAAEVAESLAGKDCTILRSTSEAA